MSTPCILLVDESLEQFETVAEPLGNGYFLDFARTMSEAMGLMAHRAYDLFILEVTLADGDGYQLCAHLKAAPQTKDTPIIFHSSRANVTDKVIAFSLGADDYIVKPCAPLELKARIDSKLRMRKRSEILSIGGMVFNFPNQKVSFERQGSQHALDLTPREFKLLTYMVRNQESVLSRNQILRAVWGENMHVSDRNIDTHIAALRKKLGAYGAYIKSVHGTGYRFSADPTVLTHEPSRSEIPS